jgi:dCMP deaminase
MSKFDKFYMDVAVMTASLSYAKRAKVGAIAVRDRNILAFGYNGTLPGTGNVCEDENGNTKPEVIHAEENLLMKIVKSSVSIEGACVYVTMSPCINCSRLMANAGIKKVIYRDTYRDLSGVYLLRKYGIDVEPYQTILDQDQSTMWSVLD